MACLDENTVALLLERQLEDASVAAIDEHVAECAACHGLLTELARFESSEREARASDAMVLPTPPPEGAALGPYLALAHAQRRIGSLLDGKWTLDRVLGIGGMAQVYAATHRNGKRVAIKILRLELCAAPSLLPRFLREGYVANKVGHASAVSVLDDGVTDDGAAFMVMELLVGETLRDRLSRVGPLGVPEALSFVDTTLDVLIAAHSKGIIHRDIKPENLFLPEDGGIKVLDFGIARIRELTRETGTTESGVAMGTPAYMPPEQARGRWDLVDARSDLWALGATLFTILTGVTVRNAKSTNEELLAAMTEPVRSIATVRPDLPAAVIEIVDRALHIDRDQRWEDAATMQRAIRDAAHGRGTAALARSARPPSASPPTGSRGPRTAVRALLALGAGSVALVSVGVALRQRESSAERVHDAPQATPAPLEASATATPATNAPSRALEPIPTLTPAAGARAAEAPAQPSVHPVAGGLRSPTPRLAATASTPSAASPPASSSPSPAGSLPPPSAPGRSVMDRRH